MRETYYTARNAGEKPTFEGKPLFRIPLENIPTLQERIVKINKKAAKLGLDPILLHEVGEIEERPETSEITGEVIAVHRFRYVTVDGHTPKLNGWELVAAIDHLGSDEGNLIRPVPGVDIDTTAYRTVEANCEHCGWKRRRNSTYVVRHDGGETKQVGTNCLGDFTGAHNPEHAAKMAEWLMEIVAVAEDSEERTGGGGGVSVVMLDEWLSWVCLSIRQSGWVSGRQAYEEGGVSTRRDAERQMWSRERDKEKPSGEDMLEAEATIQWVRENVVSIPVEDRDDFQHNMAVIFSRDYTEYKGMGISAYAPVARKRAIEQALRQKLSANSDFIGKVKGKITVTLTVLNVKEIWSRYAENTVPLYLMADEHGNEVKWFASNWNAGMEQGKAYEVTGTVKSHDDHPRFGKSTVITRCKVKEVSTA